MKKIKRHAELDSAYKNSRFRNKAQTTTKVREFGMTVAAILSAFLLFGCDQLQDSLSSEQKAEMDEDIGYAYLDGNVWYYDGISTTDFSSTTGASLAVHFTKKVEMAGTKKLEDNGTYTYSYELSGSFSANYTTTTGQSASVVTKITGGKVVLDTSDETTNISAGTLSADGKTFRLDMTPVCKLLDAATASGNELDSVEIKLKGFVCAEGDQKGRSLPAFGKIIKVKPFYEDATITDGVTFSTVSSTAGKYITIPTNGAVSFADGAMVAFATDDDSISLTSNNFSVVTSGSTLSVLCDTDLINKDFVGKLTISGFVPELNASSYTRTFTVNIKPELITLDGVLDEDIWTDAATSENSYANPSAYNLTELLVTNDDTCLYIAVKGGLSFNTNDRIILMIDNTSSSETGKSSSDSSYNNFYGPATNATFSGVDFFLCHILTDNDAKFEMQDYYWIAAAPGRTDGVETSATSTSESVIEYKIPLSIIASAATGNTLKVFVTTTSYAWTTINETTLQDCIPSAAATVSDGGQTLSIDFANALEYTVKSSE